LAYLASSEDILDFLNDEDISSNRRTYGNPITNKLACVFLQLLRRIKKELELLLKANHENIVRVFGWSVWANSMGLIMEYMSAGNLRRLLIDVDVVLHVNLRLRMSSEIANGISFLHDLSEKHRLVHGDLKPDNILLTRDLNCKIADFGGAKMVKYTRSTMTHTEVTQGQMTRAYAAPERLFRKTKSKPKKEQDTYSYGIIVHGILSREMPMEQFSSEDEYLEAVKEGERPDTEAIDALKDDHASVEGDLAIIDCLVSVMTKCWHQDPDSRPNMLLIRDELSDLFNQQSPEAIQRSVAAALGNIELFLPSERSQDTLLLRYFNASDGTFNKSTTKNVLACSSATLLQKHLLPVWLNL